MNFDFEKVKEILNIDVSDEALFKTAFTHRSYLNEHKDYENPSNERLEFLGDAVLQLLSSEYLYNKYEDEQEGVLTNYRSALVCTSSLGLAAKELGYGEQLLLSKGEEATGGRDREYILANTYEAVLGALYTEKGLAACKAFAEESLLFKVDEIVESEAYKDAKSTFQEKAQEKLGQTPAYTVLDSWGLDHDKTFKVAVFVDDKEYGVGEGSSKQRAEQEAAAKGLEKLS